jgi:hypothetical protein
MTWQVVAARSETIMHPDELVLLDIESATTTMTIPITTLADLALLAQVVMMMITVIILMTTSVEARDANLELMKLLKA